MLALVATAAVGAFAAGDPALFLAGDAELAELLRVSGATISAFMPAIPGR